MPFIFKKLEIPEVILIEPKVFEDERGFFMETYKRSDFVGAGIKDDFFQDNCSNSKKGTVRGLHYQKNPKAQAKIVRCAEGEVFDVAIDIRKGSPTFGKWASVILSSKNKKQLYIPEGFAHGFCVLSKEAQVVYKASKEFSPENDRGILFNDPEINIKWPMKNLIISPKDLKNPLLAQADNNFIYNKQ